MAAMTAQEAKVALIVGAGQGLSASLARLFTRQGMQVALAARHPDKLSALAQETGAVPFACDAADQDSVGRLFREVEQRLGSPDAVVYNPSARVKGPLVDLDPVGVANAIAVTAFGGFLVAQQAARRMVPKGHGAILLTGASASVKGYP